MHIYKINMCYVEATYLSSPYTPPSPFNLPYTYTNYTLITLS